MRIISGKLKGTSLFITQGKKTRPLKDLVKESIFNLLMHSYKTTFKFENSIILDLYSGTGSFGLECLSRGAEKVLFVENEKEALNILKKNIQKLNFKQETKIFNKDVIQLIEKKNIFGLKFDLIFCDPPFRNLGIEKLIKLIFDKKLLNKNGIIILHRNKKTKEKLDNCFKIIEERSYGISKIILGKSFP